MVLRVAGTGSSTLSGDGGLALDAGVRPGPLAFDPSGNLYFGDVVTLRRIDRDTHVITTVAGNDDLRFSGGDGGLVGQASFSGIVALAFDRAGNLFIAEIGDRVRKVSAATGIITRLAGTGTPGFSGDGGPARDAQLHDVLSVAADAAGNVFISDSGNARIRVVGAATGVINTFAGSGGFNPSFSSPDGDGGPARAARISPAALAFDNAGNLHFVDALFFGNTAPRHIRRVSAATGIITTVAGNEAGAVEADGVPATAVRLSVPKQIAFDQANNLYIADRERIHKVSAATGLVSTIAGRVYHFPAKVTADGPARSAEFVAEGLAVDPQGGVYFADPFGRVINKLVPTSHDVPLTGDLDGDGRSELVVWRPATGTWFWLLSSTGYDYAAPQSIQWGNQALGDVPLLGDIDGDRKADLIVWRASTGTWYWLTSSSGYSYEAAGSKLWGNRDLGDRPFVADIDGDRRADLIVWRASTGTWYWLTSVSGYAYAAAGAKQWGTGLEGDEPLVGDIDGDSRADFAVWRPSSGTWFWTTSLSGYANALGKQWGDVQFGDVPILTDMDGDGLADFLLFRRETGNWKWLTAFGGFKDAGQHQRQWGSEILIDQPVAGDFDGDGRTDPAVWRLSTGVWFWLASSSGLSDTSGQQKQWGR